MMVTDITGNSGGDASQVFSLLAVVANPEVYGEKLKTLVAATEEHKKYVGLIAPASEILEFRKQIEVDKAKAAKLVEDAKAEAASLKATAKSQAQAMTIETNELVARVRKLAAEAQESSAAKLLEIDDVLKDLKNQVSAAATAEKTAVAQIAAAVEEKKQLETEKVQVISIKNRLFAKAKAFAEDLTK